jgi:predicted nucleic acid-binding Zn ribbon protein
MFAAIWFVLAIAVGILGSNRGRSGFGWFLIAVITSPLLGLIFLLVLKDLSKKEPATTGPSAASHRKCPACAEWVLPEAQVCKHCGAALQPDPGFHARKKQEAAAAASQESQNLLIGVGAIAFLFLVAYIVSTLSR